MRSKRCLTGSYEFLEGDMCICLYIWEWLYHIFFPATKCLYFIMLFICILRKKNTFKVIKRCFPFLFLNSFKKIFIVIQLQLYAFSLHPSTPPQPNPPIKDTWTKSRGRLEVGEGGGHIIFFSCFVGGLILCDLKIVVGWY